MKSCYEAYLWHSQTLSRTAGHFSHLQESLVLRCRLVILSIQKQEINSRAASSQKVTLAHLLHSAASLVFSLQEKLQHRRMTFRWFSVRQRMVRTCTHFAIKVRTLGKMLTLDSNNNERQEKSCFSFLFQQQ